MTRRIVEHSNAQFRSVPLSLRECLPCLGRTSSLPLGPAPRRGHNADAAPDDHRLPGRDLGGRCRNCRRPARYVRSAAGGDPDISLVPSPDRPCPEQPAEGGGATATTTSRKGFYSFRSELKDRALAESLRVVDGSLSTEHCAALGSGPRPVSWSASACGPVRCGHPVVVGAAISAAVSESGDSTMIWSRTLSISVLAVCRSVSTSTVMLVQITRVTSLVVSTPIFEL